MTSEQHLELRERVKKANILSGQIEAAKKKVISFTAVEARCKEESKKKWAKEKLLYHINRLNELKKQYKEL